MGAQFIFVNDGILQLHMAFRAFARGPHRIGALAGGIGCRALAVDEERAHDQRKPDHNSNEDRPKWHNRYDRSFRRFILRIPDAVFIRRTFPLSRARHNHQVMRATSNTNRTAIVKPYPATDRLTKP